MRANLIDHRRADLHEAKPSLRKRILGRRDAKDPRTRTALSRAIVWDIVETSVYRRSNTIMAFASFGSELRTDEFLRHVLDQGKILCCFPESIARESCWKSTGYKTRYRIYR